ncbi:MAG: hypothetical protein GY856_37550 [bacterium]|nr:hypothetical protein [bacterium]
MTGIVAVSDHQQVLIGGDSAAITPDHKEVYSVPETTKVFPAGSFAVGITTSFRIGQVLRYGVDWPEPPADDRDLERFIVDKLVEAVRRALKVGGCGRTREGMEIGGQFVIGVRSEIFVIAEDFAVTRVPFAAIGAGRLVAYGALHALAGYDLPIEARVKAALEAAHAYTPSVRPPFGYVATPGRLVPGPRAQWWSGAKVSTRTPGARIGRVGRGASRCWGK